MSDDQVAVPPPSLEEPPCEHRIVDAWIVEGTEPEQVAMWGCRFCRIRFYPHDNVDRALLTRQEALLDMTALLIDELRNLARSGWSSAAERRALEQADSFERALLDASQPVKP